MAFESPSYPYFHSNVRVSPAPAGSLLLILAKDGYTEHAVYYIQAETEKYIFNFLQKRCKHHGELQFARDNLNYRTGSMGHEAVSVPEQAA